VTGGVVWDYTDESGVLTQLDDELVLSISPDSDPDLCVVTPLNVEGVSDLVRSLDEYTTEATARALRADRLAAAAEHLRAAGVAEYTPADLLAVADYLDGKRRL
jgi:hypothetical protein